MARTRELKVKITGDERDLSRALGRSDTVTSKWGRALSTFGKAAGLGLAGAGVAAVKFGLDFVEAAEESVKIGKQTEAVIKSTGGAAKVTADDVAELADRLSLKAGINDEVIQSGENVLLTFKNIRDEVGKGNDIFTQATTVALDMSVAMGQDLQSSVVQIGKALNDPIAGLTSLTRVGVQFTDQQKEQIKALVESGDVLGAQKIILAELTDQFGGSAEAQATASDKLKVAFGNVAEQIGMVLLPFVNQFSDWLMQKGIPFIRDELVPALQDFVSWVRDELVPALQDWWRWLSENVLPALQAVVEWLGKNDAALHILIGSLAALAAAYVAVQAAAVVAAIAAAAVWAAAALPVVALIALIAGALVVAYLLLEEPINYIRDHWRNAWNAMTGWATSAIRAVGNFFVSTFNRLRATASSVITAVVGFFTGLPGRVAGALGRVANLFGSAMSSAWRQVTGWVNRIVDAIWSIPSRIVGVAGAIKDKIAGALGGIDLTPGFDLPGFGGFLAEGGIVREPTLAVIGEKGPEAVVPLSREFGGPLGMGGHGGGPTVTVVIDRPIVADEREFRSMVRRAVNAGLAQGTINRRGVAL
jgi:hypothetical protein